MTQEVREVTREILDELKEELCLTEIDAKTLTTSMRITQLLMTVYS